MEQLIRGYQIRFKATSLKRQKVVEIVTRSKDGWVSAGRTEAKFAAVTGFECERGNVARVVLQEMTNGGGTHAFPVGTIKENHTMNIETNENLFEKKKHG